MLKYALKKHKNKGKWWSRFNRVRLESFVSGCEGIGTRTLGEGIEQNLGVRTVDLWGRGSSSKPVEALSACGDSRLRTPRIQLFLSSSKRFCFRFSLWFSNGILVISCRVRVRLPRETNFLMCTWRENANYEVFGFTAVRELGWRNVSSWWWYLRRCFPPSLAGPYSTLTGSIPRNEGNSVS